MTPKEKAKELWENFKNYSNDYISNRQCALIAIDEILLFLSLQIGFYDKKAFEYFKEVKSEIEKL